jgi:ABC-type uncharacterized transport system auxiliary subunit
LLYKKIDLPGKKMKLIALFLFLLLLLPGCFSIKSDYPEIEYFTLEQEPLSATSGAKINATLLVKDFTVNENLETDQMLASDGDGKVRRYYYYRWNSDYAAMITDFFVNRYNTIEGFTGGVVKSSSLIVPDYILEAQVLDMMAFNSDGGNSHVELKIQASLLRTVPMSSEKQIVFSKMYYNKTPRSGSAITSVIPSYSKALSKIADEMFDDIQQAVANDRAMKGKLPPEK